jgi:hypothetical protein
MGQSSVAPPGARDALVAEGDRHDTSQAARRSPGGAVDARTELARLLPTTCSGLAPGCLPRSLFLVGVGGSTRCLPMSSPQWMETVAMVAAIPNGTDVWTAVPASPPLRMTIRACLDDRCDELPPAGLSL